MRCIDKNCPSCNVLKVKASLQVVQSPRLGVQLTPQLAESLQNSIELDTERPVRVQSRLRLAQALRRLVRVHAHVRFNYAQRFDLLGRVDVREQFVVDALDFGLEQVELQDDRLALGAVLSVRVELQLELAQYCLDQVDDLDGHVEGMLRLDFQIGLVLFDLSAQAGHVAIERPQLIER